MGTPSVPSSNPENKKAAALYGGSAGAGAGVVDNNNPYLQYTPIEKTGNNSPLESVLHVFNSWSNKAETLANNIWHNRMDEYEASIQSQAITFKFMSGIAYNMAIKCALDPRLADLLHSHEVPITLTKLASSIDSPTPPDASALKRVMRLLVLNKIFIAHSPLDGGETLYGATKVSSLLASDSEISLFSILTCISQPSMITPWCYLGDCVKEVGVTGFEKAHACQAYEFASQNPEFNEEFNRGMSTITRMMIKSIVNEHGEAFDGVGSLVDVGGGTGEAISMIVKEIPHIKGINFDLPHVVSTAPEYTGVTHFDGNMFESIPKADAIFMKSTLHNLNDKDCIKILKNCKEAIPKKGGKILIVEIVVNPEGVSELDETDIFHDLMMLVLVGGKERSELEWKKLFEDGGFPRYTIIDVNPMYSLIEAYPE